MIQTGSGALLTWPQLRTTLIAKKKLNKIHGLKGFIIINIDTFHLFINQIVFLVKIELLLVSTFVVGHSLTIVIT